MTHVTSNRPESILGRGKGGSGCPTSPLMPPPTRLLCHQIGHTVELCRPHAPLFCPHAVLCKSTWKINSPNKLNCVYTANS